LDLETNYFEKKNNDDDKDFKENKKKLNEK
jgi:hypothetical protein